MKIEQDPITGLYCREDGAVLMPPDGCRFKKFRWTFGFDASHGYKRVRFHGKNYFVHRIICRSFNGLAPEDKPEVDHINRIRDDNRPENLHWVDHKENSDNRDSVDQSIMKYKVRACGDKKAYSKAYYESHREELRHYHKSHREEHRAYRKAWYERHREEINARQRACYKAHRAAFDGYEEEYAKALKP